MPRKKPTSVLSSGVRRKANTKARYSAENHYEIARAMSDYSSKNRSKESSSEEESSGSDASGSSYETASDDSSYEDFEDGHDDETEMPDDDIKHRDSEDASVESLPLLGGWIDKTCGWLDHPTACIGGKQEASLLRESKLQASPRVKRIENFVRTRGIATRKQKRSQRLERKGLADTVKADDTQTVVTINLRYEGSREESVTETPVPFVHEDAAMPVPPIPSIGFQTSGASLEPKDEEKSDHKSEHSRADKSQRSSRSIKSEKDAWQLTDLVKSLSDWADSSRKTESSPKGKSKDLADLDDGLYLPESEDILSTAIKESRSKSRSKKREEESSSTRSERASLRIDHDSMRSERASTRSERSSGRADKGSSRGERTSAREEPKITDLTHLGSAKKALPGDRSLSPVKSSGREDVQVIEVLEIDTQDSWTPGKKDIASVHSRRSRISIGPNPRAVDDDIEGRVTDLWQEEEEKLTMRASSRGRTGRGTRTIALEDEDSSKLWAQEEKKVEDNGLTDEVDLEDIEDKHHGRRETRTDGIEHSRSKSIDTSSRHSRGHRSKSREPDGPTIRENPQFQNPDPSEEKTTSRSKRESRTVGSQLDPSPRPVANLEHRQRALSRSPELDNNSVSDSSDYQKRTTEDAVKRKGLREEEIKREALVQDEVATGEGIRKSKSHSLRESTGRDPVRSASRSKSRMQREALVQDEVNDGEGIRKSKSHDLRESTGRDPVRSASRSKSRMQREALAHDEVNDGEGIRKSKSHSKSHDLSESTGRDPVRSASRSKSRMHREALVQDEVNDGEGIRKSKSHDLRESTGRDPVGSVSRSKSRMQREALAHDAANGGEGTRKSKSHDFWRMQREALAHDEVNDGKEIRKSKSHSKSHDLRESTGRDPVRSASRSKSRNDLREQSHGNMAIHRSKSRDARGATADSQVHALLGSRSSRDLRENDRPSRSHAGDAQDVRKAKSRHMRESNVLEVYGASRDRDMPTLDHSRSKSSGRSKSHDRRNAEDREPAVHKSKSREIREIVESSDIDEYAAPRPSRSNDLREHTSDNKSMRQSRSLDVRESSRTDIPELAVRSKSRDRLEIRVIHSLDQNSPTKSVHESKSRDLREATQEVLESDIRINRSRDAREPLDQDAGLRHSKSRDERKREKRGNNPEALNATKELRRLEKRLEKQLKQVKREQQPQWDGRSASGLELREMENERARRLKKDDEKRASKLKRLRQKPEFSKGQYESYETPIIQDKVRSQVQPKTIAQKVVDMRGKSEDGTRSSKTMSKHYSKSRAPRSQQDVSGPRYD
jgi:hypothetical protein